MLPEATSAWICVATCVRPVGVPMQVVPAAESKKRVDAGMGALLECSLSSRASLSSAAIP